MAKGDVEKVEAISLAFRKEQGGPPRKRPEWLRDEKRPPKAEDLQRKAQMEREDHRIRLGRIGEINDVLGIERSAFFVRDYRASRSGEVEPYYVSSIRDEHDRLCAHMCQMDLKWSAPYMDMTDRDEAMAKQAFATLMWEDMRRSHSALGNGPLQWAIPDTIQRYGMIAAWVAPDSTNESTGIDFRLLDPATVFPVYDGKRGLSHVFLIYDAPPEEVIANFNDEKNSVPAKVKKIASQSGAEVGGVTDPYWVGEVVEYWSRQWAVILYNGIEVRRWKHDYYTVPMVVKYACFGMQGFTSTPRYTIEPAEGRRRLGEISGTEDRQWDLARRAQPFLWRRVVIQAQEEKFGSRLMTMFRRAMNPPYVLQASPMSMRFAIPKIDLRDGQVSRIGETDTLTPVEMLPDNGVIAGLQSLMEANRATGMARGMLTGGESVTQTSGTALEISAQAGYESWAGVILVEEEFLTEVAERALEIWLEHGEVLGPRIHRGSLVVSAPFRDPVTKMGISFQMTPKMLKQVGTRIRCELYKMNVSQLPTTANAVGILIDKGLIDDRSAIDLMRITPDPDVMLDAIKAKKMDLIPIIEQYDIMDMFRKVARAAIDRGDVEDAARVVFRMERLTEAMQLEWAKEQVMLLQAELSMLDPMGMMMGGMEEESNPGEEEGAAGSTALPATEGPGSPGEPSPGPTANIAVQGQSMPAFGVPTGTGGGRPPEGGQG